MCFGNSTTIRKLDPHTMQLCGRNSTHDNTCYGIVIMYDKDLLYKVDNAMEK